MQLKTFEEHVLFTIPTIVTTKSCKL